MILILQPKLNIACGITKTIELLLDKLSKSYHIIVICFGGDNQKLIKEYQYNIRVVNNSLGVLKIILKETNNRIDNKVIIHSFHRSFDLLGALLSRLSKRFISLTSVQSKVTGKRYISYKSDNFIACSNFIKSHLMEYFKIPSSKIHVIPNFIDRDRIDMVLNMQNRCEIEKTEKLTIGFIGRFDFDEKGVDILLKAYNMIFEKYRNMELFLIGNGKDKNNIEDFRTNKDTNIKIIDSKNDIYKELKELNIMILPSRVEPFGIVLIEAGYLKKVVIASNVDGIPEIIQNGKNGLLFNLNDIEDLARKIEYAITQHLEVRMMGYRLYEKVISNYTAENVIPQYKELYFALLNS